MKRPEALKLRALIEQATVSLPDKEASEGVSLFPKLKEDGTLVTTGTRVNWNGVIKKAAVDLWDTAENNPDNAPTLWHDIEYKEGYRIIPDVIYSTNTFDLDEYGWWKDELYKSLIPANTYTPEQHAAGWEKVEN